MLVASSSGLGDGAREVLQDPKTEALARIITERARIPIKRLLVVGCGSGKEAAVLARALNTQVVGVDLAGGFDPVAAQRAQLQHGDATHLDFPDACFDFVFSFHVLEHIPDCPKALSEIHRVLAPNGACCIGTPNRHRLVGYVGSKDAGWRQKLDWNLADWKARLRGRFKNELGAHAGFTAKELGQALAAVFPEVDEVSEDYYGRVYRRHSMLIHALSAIGAARFLFPAVYFMGVK